MSYVDVPTSSRHELIRLASGLPWPGGEEDVGGAALLTDETDGFATDFTHATDAERVAVKTAGAVSAYALNSFYTGSGTYKRVYDIAGNLVWSAHNLAPWSETFDNASWVKVTTIVTPDAVAGPDGVVTADKIANSTTATAGRQIFMTNQPAGAVVGETYTFRVWAKAAELSWIAIEHQNLGTTKTYFNLANGTLGNVGGMHTASITPAGDGYYCQITWTAAAAGVQGMIYLQSANGQATSWAGTAGHGVYLRDAQFNRGPVATAYLPTTTLPRYALALDYDPVTHALKGLLCEPTATNLLLNNTTLSTQSVTVSAVAYTLSFWGTGTITLSGVSTAGPLVGTGASNRVSLTFTPTAGSLTLTVSGTVSRAQLETGSAATSPISTFAATVTRPSDNYNITPASINHSATAGAWWCEFSLIQGGTTTKGISYASGASPINMVVPTSIGLVASTALTKAVPGAFYNTIHKTVSTWQSADRAVTNGGQVPATDALDTALFSAPGAFIYIGGLSPNTMLGHVRKVKYLPRRMSNAEMQTVTA